MLICIICNAMLHLKNYLSQCCSITHNISELPMCAFYWKSNTLLALLISFKCVLAVREAQEWVRVKDRMNKERQDIKRRETHWQINNYITQYPYIHTNNKVRLTRSCQVNSTNTLQANQCKHPLYCTVIYYLFQIILLIQITLCIGLFISD